MQQTDRLPVLFLTISLGMGLEGCGDNTGPSIGNWPNGITNQLAFVATEDPTSALVRHSIFVAVSSDRPPRKLADVPDTIDLYEGRIHALQWNTAGDMLAITLAVPYGTQFWWSSWLIDPRRRGPLRDDSILYRTWAPDGRLWHCSAGVIYVDQTPVIRVPQLYYAGPTCPMFDVFPDGKSVALSRLIPPAAGSYSRTTGIYMVPIADTAAARLLAVDSTPINDYSCIELCEPYPTPTLAVSPAGDQVAFVHSYSTVYGEYTIWIVGLDGAPARRLTAGYGTPGWSHDGKWVLFRRGEHEIAAMRVDGTDSISLLTISQSIVAVAWSRQ